MTIKQSKIDKFVKEITPMLHALLVHAGYPPAVRAGIGSTEENLRRLMESAMSDDIVSVSSGGIIVRCADDGIGCGLEVSVSVGELYAGGGMDIICPDKYSHLEKA